MNSWAFVNSEFLINHYYLCAQVITPWPSGSWLLFLLVSKALPKPDSRFLSRTSEAWSIYLFSLYPKVWDQLPSWYSFAWKKKFKIKIWCLEWIWEAILGNHEASVPIIGSFCWDRAESIHSHALLNDGSHWWTAWTKTHTPYSLGL